VQRSSKRIWIELRSSNGDRAIVLDENRKISRDDFLRIQETILDAMSSNDRKFRVKIFVRGMQIQDTVKMVLQRKGLGIGVPESMAIWTGSLPLTMASLEMTDSEFQQFLLEMGEGLRKGVEKGE